MVESAQYGQAVGPVLGVVPVLVGPLQVLLAVLPYVALAVLSVVASLLKPRVMRQVLRALWRLKVQAVLVVACVGGVVWAASAFWPGSGGEVGDAERGGTDWPMVRGGPLRRGAPAGARGPTRGSVNWTWAGGGAAFFASPAVVGNRVYVTSAELGVFGGGRGDILCFDADTGALVWQAAPEGYRATFSSPVVAGNRLVCGEGLHFTRDARVVCLDLTPGREGTVLWTHPTASHVECAPVVADGRVYVGAGDDGYYCLDLDPGPDGAACVVWHLPGEDYPDAETSLAVADGKVYAGLGLGGKALCVLDAATGAERGRLATPYPVFSPPSIAGGKLYVGMGNGDYVHKAEEVRAATLDRLRGEGASAEQIEAARVSLGPAGEVWCVDLATLAVDWKFPVGRTVLGAVAVAGDALYFGSRDGCLYAVDLAGREIGRFDAHTPIVTSPAVTDDHVYVLTEAGTLYGLARGSLAPVWEVAVGTQPLLISSPTVARGRVYVGTQADGFVCAGEAGDETVVPVWPGRLGGPGVAGRADATPLPQRGAFHWQYPPAEAGETADRTVAAPAAVRGTDLFVPLSRKPRQGVACLPVGGDLRDAPAPRWTCRAANGVSLSPAVLGDRLFFVDGVEGDGGRRLRAVGVEDGAVAWHVPVSAEASGVLAVTADAVFVQDEAGALTCYGPDGVRRWSQEIGRLARAPAATPSMLVAATVEPASLVALDRPTGRPLWRVPLDAAPTTAPSVEGRTVYLGTGTGMAARSLVDGAAVPGWATEGGPVSGDVAVGRDRLVYVSDGGDLVVLDRATGRLLRRAPGALPGLAPLADRAAVLYFAKEGLMRLDLAEAGARPTVWTDTSWLGRPTAPAVAVSGRLYVGMAGWGLVCLGAGR